jgi:hypothetical protein
LFLSFVASKTTNCACVDIITIAPVFSAPSRLEIVLLLFLFLSSSFFFSRAVEAADKEEDDECVS